MIQKLFKQQHWDDIRSLLQKDEEILVSSRAEEDNVENSDNNKTETKQTTFLMEQYPLLLHYACSNAAPPDIVRCILSLEEKVATQQKNKKKKESYLCRVRNTKNNNRIAIHVACGNKYKHKPACDISVFELLLEYYPDCCTIQDTDDMYPLHTACLEEAPIAIIELLIKAHSNACRQQDVDGNLPIHWMFRNNNQQEEGITKLIQSFLQAYPECLSIPNTTSGYLPLHRAILSHAPLSTIQILLQEYPDAASVKDHDGNLPIHLLCSSSSSETTTTTATTTASATDSDKNKNNKNNNNENEDNNRRDQKVLYYDNVLKELLNVYPQGAETFNNYNELPLHRAVVAEGANVSLVQLLIQAFPHGVQQQQIQTSSSSTTTTTTKNNTNDVVILPLHLACTYDASIDVIQLLLDSYPEAAAITTDHNNNMMPIHCAIRNNAPSAVIKALLEAYPEGASKTVPIFASTTTAGDNNNDDCHCYHYYLPIHFACVLRAPLDVVQVLTEAYPDGLTASLSDSAKDSSSNNNNNQSSPSYPIHLACDSDAPLDVLNFLLERTPKEIKSVAFLPSSSSHKKYMSHTKIPKEEPDNKDDQYYPKDYIREKQSFVEKEQEVDAHRKKILSNTNDTTTTTAATKVTGNTRPSSANRVSFNSNVQSTTTFNNNNNNGNNNDNNMEAHFLWSLPTEDINNSGNNTGSNGENPHGGVPTLAMGTTICVEKHMSEQGNVTSTSVFVLEEGENNNNGSCDDSGNDAVRGGGEVGDEEGSEELFVADADTLSSSENDFIDDFNGSGMIDMLPDNY